MLEEGQKRYFGYVFGRGPQTGWRYEQRRTGGRDLRIIVSIDSDLVVARGGSVLLSGRWYRPNETHRVTNGAEHDSWGPPTRRFRRGPHGTTFITVEHR